MSGARILEGLREAVSGDFASALVEGQHWYRQDTVNRMIAAERERCAQLAEAAHAIEWKEPDSEYAKAYLEASDALAASIRDQQ